MTKSNSTIIDQQSYVIAVIDDGVPRFGVDPKIYRSDEAAREEVARLTQLKPGKVFAYFKCEGKAVCGGIVWY